MPLPSRALQGPSRVRLFLVSDNRGLTLAPARLTPGFHASGVRKIGKRHG